jgi:uncharacterized membrane protein required for colicin V production
VDLVIVIILVRACYSGYDRGLVVELLHVVGLVLTTGLAMNYHSAVTAWIQVLLPWQLSMMPAIAFWALFLTLLGVKRFLVRSLTQAVKWERLYWALQGLGVVLGGIRGIWWSGVFLIALANSGISYLQQSGGERAVLGSRLLPMARNAMTVAADALPGANHRGPMLIPPFDSTPASPAKHST